MSILFLRWNYGLLPFYLHRCAKPFPRLTPAHLQTIVQLMAEYLRTSCGSDSSPDCYFHYGGASVSSFVFLILGLNIINSHFICRTLHIQPDHLCKIFACLASLTLQQTADTTAPPCLSLVLLCGAQHSVETHLASCSPLCQFPQL